MTEESNHKERFLDAVEGLFASVNRKESGTAREEIIKEFGGRQREITGWLEDSISIEESIEYWNNVEGAIVKGSAERARRE